MTTPAPVIVAAAVVIEDGAVLLTQRPAGTHLAGHWEFPGGKVEPGESPEDAVVRECREECGIDLQVVDILDVTFHRYETKSVLLLFYRCERRSGDIAHLGIAAHAWARAPELDSFELPPADVRVRDKVRILLAPTA